MSFSAAAVSGLVGAAVVTGINESARRLMPEKAPRMEILGMRALAKGLDAVDQEIPPRRELIKIALAGDVLGNTAYYSLVGLARPESAVATGAALGLAAGIGGVLLPEPLGLGSAPSGRSPETMAMTVAWYTVAGVAAGLAYRFLASNK
jgi:hypothetical protein